ncbi:MAG TPA: SCO family protein [Thiobacillaceae bacterium]|nr:SCO family protein [Thiobacillaceae bacterium]HNU64817.1 SCO family protein [Thiobacillaceae bacterium]
MERRGFLGLALPSLMLAGCGGERSRPGFKGSDITGVDFGRQLELTDHNGRPVSLESFRGRLIVLFFGYTHCPDVCPTTLSDMAQALELLGPEAATRVQVLFVSVDPERDTQEILRAYVPHFHPSFLGLRGSPEEVARAAKEFHIVYGRHAVPGATDYLVDHSAGSYVLDGQGRLRLYLPYAQSPRDIAHDLRTLLAMRPG